MTRAKILWRTPLVLFPLAVVGAFAYGCADPPGDLDDFKVRNDEAKKAGTAGSGVAGSGVGGSAGSTAGVADIDGTFLFACITEVTPDIATALRFVAEVDLTLTGAGGAATGGTLNVSLRAVKSGSNNASDLVSDALAADTPSTLDEKGEFVFTYASVQIPGEANTTGRNIVLNEAVFKGAIQSADRFCARFRGNVVEPLQYPLQFDAVTNTCVAARLDDSGMLPIFGTPDISACQSATSILTPPP
ncbi:MAG: hypothetical protein MUF34_27345 [Polyangiaceae bacterium]|jgi:hypothetical protein|nr:hypothetical protein [Polyangiaceae bacterium]